MPVCQVKGCMNRRGEGVSTFQIPDARKSSSKIALAREWFRKLGITEPMETYSFGHHKFVCIAHFSSDAIISRVRDRPTQDGRMAKKAILPHAVPTLYLSQHDPAPRYSKESPHCDGNTSRGGTSINRAKTSGGSTNRTKSSGGSTNRTRSSGGSTNRKFPPKRSRSNPLPKDVRTANSCHAPLVRSASSCHAPLVRSATSCHAPLVRTANSCHSPYIRAASSCHSPLGHPNMVSCHFTQQLRTDKMDRIKEEEPVGLLPIDVSGLGRCGSGHREEGGHSSREALAVSTASSETPCLSRANGETNLGIPTSSGVGVATAANMIGRNQFDVIGGNRSDVIGGIGSHVIGGIRSDMIGGIRSDMIGGIRSDMIGGIRSDMIGGIRSDMIGGIRSDVIDGIRSDVIEGIRSDMIGGIRSDVVEGIRSDMIGGIRSDMIGGIRSDVIERIRSDVIEGIRSDVMEGIRSDVVGGIRSDMIGGIRSVVGMREDRGPVEYLVKTEGSALPQWHTEDEIGHFSLIETYISRAYNNLRHRPGRSHGSAGLSSELMPSNTGSAAVSLEVNPGFNPQLFAVNSGSSGVRFEPSGFKPQSSGVGGEIVFNDPELSSDGSNSSNLREDELMTGVSEVIQCSESGAESPRRIKRRRKSTPVKALPASALLPSDFNLFSGEELEESKRAVQTGSTDL